MTTTAQSSNLPVDEVHTTPQALRRAARLWPDGEAVADVQSGEDVRWTWTELAEQVRTFAAAHISMCGRMSFS